MHAMYALKRENEIVEVHHSLVRICARGPRVTRRANGKVVIPPAGTKLVRVLVVECETPEQVQAWEAH